MSNAFTKESLEKFNREQLMHVILIEQRQAAIRESCVKNLEAEMERQQKDFQIQSKSFIGAIMPRRRQNEKVSVRTIESHSHCSGSRKYSVWYIQHARDGMHWRQETRETR